MTPQLAPPPKLADPEPVEKRRSAFKQRLVDVECGVRLGFRRDCTFFVHFFVGSIVIATGFVLKLELWQWVTVVLSLTMVLTAEMFQQVLKTILEAVGQYVPEAARRAERIGAAAVFVAIVGTAITVGMIFAQRLVEVFQG